MNKVELIVKALDEKMADNIEVLDMQLASPIFDTFIICTASNERLMQAIRDNVQDKLEENGIFVKKIEGMKNSKWILMDYADVIVHIFETEERKAYNLEKLWADMPRVNIEGMID
ncbi:ribosome silencing factor [Tannockella kyphosi]|uniref:ribosome silencing factor n=1 Tax=Tannockella kyphosi TaxID=2899121 RepID=UPI0020131C6C|nr:ribosome silencing factor [Tannockella kyphosi]